MLFRSSVDAPVLLARLPDDGGVDDGEELLDVVDEELVEEPLVPLLEVHHGDVALQGHGVLAQVVHDLLLLVLLRDDRRREQAPQVVRVALRLREGQPLVVPGITKKRVPAVAHKGKKMLVLFLFLDRDLCFLTFFRTKRMLKLTTNQFSHDLTIDYSVCTATNNVTKHIFKKKSKAN